MTQRKCSCCGETYTDESGHDIGKCIGVCRTQLHNAEKDHANARDDLERAYERKIAQLYEALKELTAIFCGICKEEKETAESEGYTTHPCEKDCPIIAKTKQALAKAEGV